jgi:hypothetical protein
MTGEDGHRHRMVSRVVASGSADVGVRVDPEHRKLLPITLCQPGEWCHAHRALSAKREDALRAVAAYHLQGGGQLREHGLLGFDAVLLGETTITELDRNQSGRSAVRWQHRIENGSSYGIASTSFLEGDLRE